MPTKQAEIGKRKHKGLAEDAQTALDESRHCLLEILSKTITDPRIVVGINNAAAYLLRAQQDLNQILLLIAHAEAEEFSSMIDELEERNARYESLYKAQQQQISEMGEAIKSLSERVGVPVELPKIGTKRTP